MADDLGDLKTIGGASILELMAGAVLVLIALFAIYKNTYHMGTQLPTCENFIYNTYAYVVLGLLLIVVLCMANDKVTILPNIMSLFGNNSMIMNIVIIIAIIAILLLFIYLTKSTDAAAHPILVHVFWLCFIYILATLFYILYLLARIAGVWFIGLLITAIVVGITMYIGYKYPGLIPQSAKIWLFVAAVILIVLSLVGPYFIKDMNALIILYAVIAFGFIVIFSLFLLLEADKVREDAKTCVSPNYPGESTMIIYDIYIILNNILQLLLLKKMRGGK